MRIDKRVDIVFKRTKELNGDSPDLTIRNIKIINKNIGYMYLESVTSDDKVSNFLMKSIVKVTNNTTIFDNLFKNIYKELENSIYNSKIKTITTYEDIIYYLSSGFTCVVVDGFKEAIVLETKETLDRGVSEPVSETTIKGPKDAFTENYNKNIGLIRKRIKDSNLWLKEYSVGTRTKTKISIMYINDIANKDRVKYIEKKIKNIDIDGILDSGYIRDFLVNDNYSTFPTVINTERPDIVCGGLLEGRIAIIIENTPYVIVIPGVLNDFIHSPEDNYQKAINISLTRFLRFLALIITLTAPAIYIAVTTFNQEVIPDTLLISLALQRARVPFPNAFAIFILMITFEILRESDIRLPSSMGTSISIVGALVLGDAAVNAGLVSPMAVIIVAITAITGLLFTDLDVTNAFRWWRMLFLLFATTMGLIGFVCAGIIFITKLSSMESFGVAYLEPFSPFNKVITQDSILTKPRNKMKNRPKYLTKNIKRLGDKDE